MGLRLRKYNRVKGAIAHPGRGLIPRIALFEICVRTINVCVRIELCYVAMIVSRPFSLLPYTVVIPAKASGICFHRHWFVCARVRACVCLPV